MGIPPPRTKSDGQPKRGINHAPMSPASVAPTGIPANMVADEGFTQAARRVFGAEGKGVRDSPAEAEPGDEPEQCQLPYAGNPHGQKGKQAENKGGDDSTSIYARNGPPAMPKTTDPMTAPTKLALMAMPKAPGFVWRNSAILVSPLPRPSSRVHREA